MLTGADLEAAFWLANNFVDTMRAAGRPINPGIEKFHQKVTLTWEIARAGNESQCDTGEYESWMTTRQAAKELRRSPRQVRNLKAELDGELFNGRLRFSAAAVRAYPKGRRND